MPEESVGWSRCAALSPYAEVAEVLDAAGDDIRDAQRLAVGTGSAPALPIVGCRVAAGTEIGWHLVVELLDGRRQQRLFISECAIRLAWQGRMAPLVLVACAMVEGGALGDEWRPARVGTAHLPEQARSDVLGHLSLSEAGGRALDALRDDCDVMLFGDHGCGKSAIAERLANLASRRGDTLIWLDLADVADGPASILATLLQSRRSERCLLVVDNLDANLPVVDSIFNCVSQLRSIHRLTVRVLVTTLRSVDLRRDMDKPFVRVHVDGASMIDLAVASARLDGEQAAAVRSLAAGDVHLARLALEYHRRHGLVPTEVDLQGELTAGVTEPRQRFALYWFAALGYLGVEPYHHDATIELGAPVVQLLRDKQLIYRTDSTYTIGHRRVAQLVLSHAVEQWDAVRNWGRPGSIAWRYVRFCGDNRMIRAILSRLDMTVDPEQLHDRGSLLLTSWKHLCGLEQWIKASSEELPDWQDSLAAAVFAAENLAKLGHEQVWLKVANQIRSRWTYGDPDDPRQLPYSTGGVSSDFADFPKIAECMREEDREVGDAPYLHGMVADGIDLDRFCRTWALGLLLGLEGGAPPKYRDPERIRQLLAIAQRAIEIQGNFYPARVPWITARMVLGLCAVGRGYFDDTVARACRWLLQPVTDGGSCDGWWWRGGTGAWNRREATTAMCLTALLQADVPRVVGSPAHGLIRNSFAWLRGQQEEWMRSDRHIDLANVLMAETRYAEEINETHQHVSRLLRQVLLKLPQPPQPDDPTPEERHRTPFLASVLAQLVWGMITRDCEELFAAVMEPVDRGVPVDAAPAGVRADVTEPPGARAGVTASAATPDAGCAPGGAPGVTVRLGPGDMTLWQSATARLGEVIKDDIVQRSRVLEQAAGGVPMPAIKRELERFEGYQRRWQRLVVQLDTVVHQSTLVELDALGFEVDSRFWPPGLPGLPGHQPPGPADALGSA